MTQDYTKSCSPRGLEEMDASSPRVVTAGVLPGCCFCTALEIVTSGEASEAGVKLESQLSPFLCCSARLEVDVRGRVAPHPGGGAGA